VKKKRIIAIEADPGDTEDRPVSAEGLAKAREGRRIRRLRNRLGLSQSEFAGRYGIPLANIRQYEIGRVMPPPAVRAYLAVIAEEPRITAEAYRRSRAA
jgi:putative transcriptional regulator